MSVTAERIVRQELVGLAVRVADAADPTLAGREGTVVDETTNTLELSTERGTVRLPKADCTFEFRLPGDGDVTYVTVEGAELVGQPAERTERTRTRWH
jgi:RNase P/RNase MRP subunit p29